MCVLYRPEVTPLYLSTQTGPHGFIYCTSTKAFWVPGILLGCEDIAGRKKTFLP